MRKFDPNGISLGTFIGSTRLQGPVGLWIGENDDLYVIDWTLGDVLRFDSDGNYIETFITGMVRTEGNAQGPDGKYYLCDWERDRVNRYNGDGSFDRTLVSVGLSSSSQ